MADALLRELFEMWLKHHETFIVGKRFAVLAYPRGAYGPGTDGPVRDTTVFLRMPPGSVSFAFSLTDDPEAERSDYCLRVLEPDPDLIADGVASPDTKLKLRYQDDL